MSNKETVIKKILKLVAKLHNECKVPSVFGVNSTNGVIYGAMNKTTGQPVVLKQIKKIPKRGALSEIPREIQMHKIASTCPSGGCVQMTEW